MSSLRSGKVYLPAESAMSSQNVETPHAPPRNRHGHGSPNADYKSELQQLHKLIADLQASVDKHRDITNNKLKALEEACGVDNKIKGLRDSFDLDIGQLTARIELVENRVVQIEKHFEFNPEVTVVIQGLTETPGENLQHKTESLVHNSLGKPEIPVVRSKRLTSRNGYPGLVKMEFRNLEDKKRVLRAKRSLKQVAGFERVYLRSSKTHVERLHELNTKLLLEELPNGHLYFITAHGKLVKKDGDRPGDRNNGGRQQRGRQLAHDDGGNRGNHGAGRGNRGARHHHRDSDSDTEA